MSDEVKLDMLSGEERKGGEAQAKQLPVEQQGLVHDVHDSDEELPDPYAATWNPFKRLERWYPFAACGHDYHWTEVVLVLFLATAVLLFIVTTSLAALPVFLFCLLTSAVSILSFMFIWGIAHIKSLAGIATELERKQHQLKLAKDVMKENSEQLKIEVDGIKEEMGQFAQGLGLLESNLDGLDEVESGLQRVTDAIELNQNIERELGKHEADFARVQQEYLEEKEKEQLKQRFVTGGLFQLATDDGCIDSKEEFDNLWELLDGHDYLKKLEARGVDWRAPIKQLQKGGKVSLWELLDAIDVATNSHFLKIRNADQELQRLERELGEVEDELDRLDGRR